MPPPRSIVTATDPGEVVVLILGVTINRPWKVWSWAPVARAMTRMLFELGRRPELGLLNAHTQIGMRGITVLQYWRSFEQLEQFARSRNNTHLPEWADFYKRAASTNGDLGIWHETYITKPGERESIYVQTPRIGLAKAVDDVHPIGAGEETSAKRQAAGAVT